MVNESLDFARQRGPRWVEYFALVILGEAARISHNYQRAESLLGESLSLSREAGDRCGGSQALWSMALLAMMQGQIERAYGCAREALIMTVQLGDTRGTTYVLETLACIASAHGRASEAARLFGAAQALRQPIGEFLAAPLRMDRELGMAAARIRIGDAAFEGAWAEGWAMSMDQAVVYARSMDSRPKPKSEETGAAPLTARELEVLRLVAQGKTNREIGTDLVVSHRTVKRHLDNIFAKFNVSTRTAATALAVRGGLA
jgi:ATP/maltotriose-dependent transcriptional regulator MalT